MSKAFPDFVLLIKNGEQLPHTGKIFTIYSALDEQHKRIKVKAIHGLKWNQKGDLVVACDGVVINYD